MAVLSLSLSAAEWSLANDHLETGNAVTADFTSVKSTRSLSLPLSFFTSVQRASLAQMSQKQKLYESTPGNTSWEIIWVSLLLLCRMFCVLFVLWSGSESVFVQGLFVLWMPDSEKIMCQFVSMGSDQIKSEFVLGLHLSNVPNWNPFVEYLSLFWLISRGFSSLVFSVSVHLWAS